MTTIPKDALDRLLPPLLDKLKQGRGCDCDCGPKQPIFIKAIPCKPVDLTVSPYLRSRR